MATISEPSINGPEFDPKSCEPAFVFEAATGNYVKTVQRLPVRIRLYPGEDAFPDNFRIALAFRGEPEVVLDASTSAGGIIRPAPILLPCAMNSRRVIGIFIGRCENRNEAIYASHPRQCIIRATRR